MYCVCLKWRPDGRFPNRKWAANTFMPEHVDRLAERMKRYAPEHQFICFTDDPTGLECNALPLPYVQEAGENLWTRKLALFNSALVPFEKGARVLYLDLDVIPVGDLTDALSLKERIVVTKNMSARCRWPVQGSAFLWTNGDEDRIWDYWIDRYKLKTTPPVKAFLDDQQIVQYAAQPQYFQDLVPDHFVDYKYEKYYDGGHDDARLVYFHGNPRPWETDLWSQD